MRISTFIPGISFILLTTLALNCNSSETKQKVGTKEDLSGSANYNPYFPADQGYKWEYINEAPREETEKYIIEITGTSMDGKDVLADFSSFPFFSKKEEKTVLRIKENGAVYFGNEMMLPENSKLVKDFNWKFGEWTGYVAGTNDTVKAENETFTDCVLISYSISITFAADIWLARDKGIVKWGYNRTNPPTFKPLYYVLNKLTLAK
jgi:hypothetical protein